MTPWIPSVVSPSARSCVAVVAFALTWLSGCGRPTTSLSGTLPPIAAAPVKNATTDVAYIGTERCAACHREEENSYHHTAHSQALAELDLDAEPPDGEFSDPLSQRHYRIYRQDGSLRHEESIRTSAGEPLILCDLPVRYVIGSGRFSRSYLVERDGYFFESPVTWYTEPKEWKLSPGYEQANLGFQRPVELRCLVCHAGRVEPIDRSPQHVRLPSLAIDCERCHGPGELHARKWEGVVANREAHTGPDDTIFNPAKFDRQLGEDVCAQCHLHSAATVELRGRSLLDFRPGRKLSDYLAHYAPQSPKIQWPTEKGESEAPTEPRTAGKHGSAGASPSQNPASRIASQMKVVGHVEQLRLSRCYQADSRMSCLTCHDPHAETSPAERKAVYRDKCLKCHAEQSCKESDERRHAPHVQDDCVQCHMPRGPTEIPHFAFTHHRVGIHQASPPSPPTGTDELVLIPGSARVTALEELRNRGLGYLQFSDASAEPQRAAYRAQSQQLLHQYSRSGGAKDPDVDAALARLHWGLDLPLTLKHAQAVVAEKEMSPEAWATGCFTMGTSYYALNRPTEARPWIERSLVLRPTADGYIMLSDCLAYAGETSAALDAARRACEMAPDRPRYLQQRIELLNATGRTDEAERLQPRLEELFQYRRRVDPPR